MPKASPVLILGALFFTGTLASTAACSRDNAEAPAAATASPEYVPTATVKDLMLSLVDPSADEVWNAVSSTVVGTGVVETVPQTDEDWTKLRHGALKLAEAANLLQVPGRHVARPGEKSETPGVELEPSEMEELINKDRAAFNARAQALRQASLDVLQAIDARDAEKVFDLGDEIDQACENCHTHYWYPNEKVPEFPRSSSQ
jgi:cytochrome c556